MPISQSVDSLSAYINRDSYYEPSYISFCMINDYERFVQVIENQINVAIRMICRNPQYIKEAGEDEITDKLICCLCASGLDATHDAMSGGHADIVIKNMHFDWLGEAKRKHASNAYEYLWGGFLQLTERYSSNANGCNKGGFFVYIQQDNSARVMERWKQHMNNQVGYGFQFQESSGYQAFTSQHTHTRFGDGCNITHFAISAYHNPQD